jgi:hypothetical protein
MKHVVTILCLLLLLAVVGNVKAQGYQSYFGADSTRLNVYELCIDFDPTIYLTIYSADTVNINGQDYLQGIPQGEYAGFFHDEEEFYFREDTILGRLYRYVPELDEELVLSDMSLLVGDTITFSDEHGDHYAVVESVSFENGRKVIKFTASYYYGITYYEGVFPPFFPIGYIKDYYYYSSCDNYLLCEYKDGEQIFDNHSFGTCYIGNDMSVREIPQRQVLVYPTKARPIETIRIETSESIQEVALCDFLGRKIPTVNDFESSRCWNMTILSHVSGVYIVRITTRKGIYYEKILIHN